MEDKIQMTDSQLKATARFWRRLAEIRREQGYEDVAEIHEDRAERMEAELEERENAETS